MLISLFDHVLYLWNGFAVCSTVVKEPLLQAGTVAIQLQMPQQTNKFKQETLKLSFYYQ